jgi:hypothetical protein
MNGYPFKGTNYKEMVALHPNVILWLRILFK